MAFVGSKRSLLVPRVISARTLLPICWWAMVSTVANYRPGVGVTGTLNATAWANQIGAAGSLAEVAGSGRSIFRLTDESMLVPASLPTLSPPQPSR